MLVFHVLMSFLLAILAMFWTDFNQEGAYYLRSTSQDYVAEDVGMSVLISTFLTTFCLNSTFIPVSLLVAIDIIKMCQTWFITRDVEMITETPDGYQPCQVNTSSLNEELGQVRYVFTDKTGTLTRNIMEFKLCIIGRVVYGDEPLFEGNQPVEMSGSSLFSNSQVSVTSSRKMSLNVKQGTSYNFKN